MSAGPIIVGLGELLWDVYPDGEHLGGAPANFASQAAALGAEAWLVSAVGADDRGSLAIAEMRERGVRVDHVAVDEGHATGCVNVTLDDEKRPTFTIASDVAWDHIEWRDDLRELARSTDAVCFGTLAQRNTTSRATIARFVQETRRDALRVLDVNLRQSFYNRDVIARSLAIASVLKLNETELPVLARLLALRGANPVDTLRDIRERYDLHLVVLTRGPDGAVLVSANEVSEEAAPPVNVVDTVGAGDAFTASLVSDMLRGVSLGEANRRANAVAALVCSVAGAVHPGLAAAFGR